MEIYLGFAEGALEFEFLRVGSQATHEEVLPDPDLGQNAAAAQGAGAGIINADGATPREGAGREHAENPSPPSVERQLSVPHRQSSMLGSGLSGVRRKSEVWMEPWKDES